MFKRVTWMGIGMAVGAAGAFRAKRKVEEATEACKASPPGPVELLTKDVYSDGGWAWRN